MENSIQVPQKIKNPAILLLGVYSEKITTLIPKDICNPMFIAALFTITKI